MYAPIGIPMLLAGIVYFVFIGYRLLPKTSAKSVAEVAETKPDFSHVPKWKQITSLVVLIAVILAMIFEKQIGIPIGAYKKIRFLHQDSAGHPHPSDFPVLR